LDEETFPTFPDLPGEIRQNAQLGNETDASSLFEPLLETEMSRDAMSILGIVNELPNRYSPQ
jgi:hypothetical protein